MKPQYLLMHEPVNVTLPYSEVCMHMQVAGQISTIIPHPNGMAQILNDDGMWFSFPITWGEAGIYKDLLGMPYVSVNATDSGDHS